MTSTRSIGLLALALSGTAGAADYCTFPYLYATNIRPACEQYGSTGMAGLYESNKAIAGMLSQRARITARHH